MTIEPRADNKNDAQYHKRRRVLFALWVTSFALCFLILCYGTVYWLQYRARLRVKASQVLLPRWRTEVLPEVNGPTQLGIPLQGTVVHRADPPEQDCALLNLPAEIRVRIYSYLIPNVRRPSVSRTLRQTCRQIDHEVEYKARKAFTRQLISLQKLLDDEPQLATVFYSAATYHVEVVLQPPQTYSAQSVSPPVQHAQTLIDALALSCVGFRPFNTRSITITLQPHPRASLSSFQRYLDTTWSTLEGHFNRVLLNHAKEWKTDLRKITIVCGYPAILVPQVGLGGFKRKLEWIIILGVIFRCDQEFQCVRSFVLDSRQRYLGLAIKLLRYGNRGAGSKMFMRFTQ